MAKQVFVTGATGFIGSYLVRKLAENGSKVIGLARNLSKEKFEHPNVSYKQGDILDLESLKKASENCDELYHLAAFAKVWSKNQADFYDYNVLGTTNVLDAAIANGIKDIVITGTAGIWGASIRGVVNEEHSRDLDFFNEYEGSKCFSESRIKDYIIRHDMNVRIVAPTRVYGNFLFGKPQGISLLIDKYVNGKWRLIPGKGDKVGNYVHVLDVAEGHLLAMEKGVKGESYILGGENLSYREFFNELSIQAGIKRKMIPMPHWAQTAFAKIQLSKAKLFGSEPLITPKWTAKGKYHWEVDCSKAKQALDYSPMTFKEGVQKDLA
jgi:farnesol dehydrogenase